MKMKKLLALFLALAMCASLAACGGGDDTPADDSSGSDVSTGGDVSTDAQVKALEDVYNQLSVLYNDAATKAQENGWTADADINDDLQEMSSLLDSVGEALNGDMSVITDIEELTNVMLEMVSDAETLAEQVATPYPGGGAVTVTDEALKPLADIYTELANKYNEVYTAAEANGWLADETTSAEMDTAYAMITYVGSGLTDDPSKLEDTDLDALVEQLRPLIPALDEIAGRVSVPYEG